MNRQNAAREGYDVFLWFHPAAVRGNPYAQFNLGLL